MHKLLHLSSKARVVQDFGEYAADHWGLRPVKRRGIKDIDWKTAEERWRPKELPKARILQTIKACDYMETARILHRLCDILRGERLILPKRS